MKDLINEQPEQDIEHCATCIHAADSEDICILRKCKYAIAELKDCYEPKPHEIIHCRDCYYYKRYEYSGVMACHYVIGGTVQREPHDFCSRAERREVSK
jgi:hypothetical protein